MDDRRTAHAGQRSLAADKIVTVVPRGDGAASARTAPTLLGAVRAVAKAVLEHPEAALVLAIVAVLLGDIAGWW